MCGGKPRRVDVPGRLVIASPRLYIRGVPGVPHTALRAGAEQPSHPRGPKTLPLHLATRLARRTPFFYGWVVLYGASAAQFASNAAASLTMSVFIYPISQDLGWSRTLIAGAASLGGLVATVQSPLIGWLMDRYGIRVVLVSSVLALGLSVMYLSWATAPLAFYIAYGIARSMFSSPIKIGSSVAVSRWFIERRGRATGVLFLSHAAGMTAFPLVAGLVIARSGWQDAWLVLGAIVLAIALVPAMLIVQNPEDAGLRPDGKSTGPATGASTNPDLDPVWTLGEAVRTPALWLLALAGGFAFMIQAGTNVHIGAFFRDQGLDAGVATLAVSVNAMSTGAGSLVWGWLVDRAPVRYVFAAVALLMTIGVVLIVNADTPFEAIAYSCVFGSSIGGILVVPPVAFANYFGRSSIGVIRGVTEPFASGGQAVAVLFSGIIFDSTQSYQAAFLTFAVLGAITVLMLLFTKPPRRRDAGKRSDGVE